MDGEEFKALGIFLEFFQDRPFRLERVRALSLVPEWVLLRRRGRLLRLERGLYRIRDGSFCLDLQEGRDACCGGD